MSGFASSAWAPFYVLAAYLVGGLVAFPLILLIAGTAAAFGPVLALPMALLAASPAPVSPMRSAPGSAAGPWRASWTQAQPHPRRHRPQRHSRHRRHTPRARRSIHDRQHGRGRLHIRIIDYMVGTALGLLPGLLLMSALGYQIFRFILAPSAADFLLLAAAAVVVDCRRRRCAKACGEDGERQALSSSASTVRVMTWNIHGGMGPDGRHDLERMLALVRAADPDVLALQEVDSRRTPGQEHPFAMLKRVLGHHGIAAAAITTPDGDYGQVLFSRWPMTDTQVHDISMPGREPRRAITAVVNAPAGQLFVLATHLGLKFIERHRQCRQMAALADAPR